MKKNGSGKKREECMWIMIVCDEVEGEREMVKILGF